MDYEKLLLKITLIAEQAGKMLLEFQPRVKEIKKRDNDFLSTADLKSNSFILKQLRRIAPDIEIYSEDTSSRFDASKTVWIVDPLDGTINYFDQDTLWGLSIALIENQKPKLGVICLPALNQTAAAAGDKIVIKGTELKLRKDKNMREARIWTDWNKISRQATLSVLNKLSSSVLYPQIRLCSSFAYMAIITGRISGFVYPCPTPEDMAAGCLLVKAAGGKVTDFNGNPWSIKSDSIIASNGLIHNELLELFKE